MRRTTKVLLIAGVLAAVVGACGRADGPAAPDSRQAPAADLTPVPEPGGTAPQDTPPPPDTTGRWGGGLGSGT